MRTAVTAALVTVGIVAGTVMELVIMSMLMTTGAEVVVMVRQCWPWR